MITLSFKKIYSETPSQLLYRITSAIATCGAYLVKHHPVWINLGITFRVQYNSLIGPEVCECNLSTLWTHIYQIHHCVIVKVILTHISDTITYRQWKRENIFDWVVYVLASTRLHD